jgi:hypothetical protein
VTSFDSKIAIVLRSDLATWQALNVTAFLTSGLAAAYPEMIGAPYRNAYGHTFLALSVQPVIVLTGDLDLLRRIHKRAIERDVPHAAYVADMFTTYDDEANRAVFAASDPDSADLVGLALRAERRVVDKITKGAGKHP